MIIVNYLFICKIDYFSTDKTSGYCELYIYFINLAPCIPKPAIEGGFWPCSGTVSKQEPIMSQQKPIETTQYGIFNFESVSSGLNMWSIIITIIIILCLIFICESCCTRPSQMLQCCFRQRNLLRNAPPASGRPDLQLGNTQVNLQPWASYPGLATTLPPINWKNIGAEQLSRLPLATPSIPSLPPPGGLISLQMADGRLAVI